MFQKTFHIKTLIQYRILLQGDLGEVFIRHFITKWGCGAGAGCAGCGGCAAVAARGAATRRAASPATSRVTLGAAGTARTGAAPAPARRPRRPGPARRGTPAVVAADQSLKPRDAAAPTAVALDKPTVPTVPPLVHRTEDTLLAETIATSPQVSPSLPVSNYYYADPSQKVVVVTVRNAAPPASIPSSP